MKKITPAILMVAFSTLLYCCGPSNASDNESKAADHPDLVNRGKYLVQTMGCNDCHSPKVMGPMGPMPDTNRLLSGYNSSRPLPEPDSNQIKKGWLLFAGDLTAAAGPWGLTYAANISSDSTGIGNWTEAQFVKAMTRGISKGLDGNRPLLPPMPWQNFVNLKQEDLSAIFAYLKSTRPVHNIVPPPVMAGPRP